MYLLKVIPIGRGFPEKYFSYFSKNKLSTGALTEIKIGRRKVFSIVLEVKDIKSEKINIKGENFSLKKIERIVKENFIKENILKTISELSFLLGVKESDIFEIFLNDDLLEELMKDNSKSSLEKNKKQKINKEAVIGNQEERIKEYLKNINKEIKEGNSSAIFCSTLNDLKYLKSKIENNFKDENLVILHGDQSKKERKENLEKLENENPKILFITPSIFPFLIKNKISLNIVIIEKENSFNYFSHNAKKEIDSREIIKNLANASNIKTILGGEILSLNTFKEIKEKKIKLKNLNQNTENKKILILDLAKEKNTEKNKYSNVYFKKEVRDKLEDYKNKKEGKIFLYTKRKGIAGEIVCRDCNHVFKCKSCDKPYILFKENQNGKREYLCAICKTKNELNKEENLICENCGGLRMQSIGIGTEGIEENLKENGFKVFVIDAKNTNTKKKIKEALENWQKEKLSILIGTDLALNNLNENYQIDFAGIVSIDSLFSIPEINIDEKIINLIIEFKERCKTKNKLFIETRLRDAEIWKYIEENNYLEFLEKEIENRKNINLPPFVNIFKFKLNNKNYKYKNQIEKLLSEIQKEENVNEEKINWKKDSKTGDYIGILMIKKKDLEIFNEENNIFATNFAKKIHTLLSDFNLEINPQNVYK